MKREVDGFQSATAWGLHSLPSGWLARRAIPVAWPVALLVVLWLGASPRSACAQARGAFRSAQYCEGLCAKVGRIPEGATPVLSGTDVGLGYIDHAGKWVIPPKYRFADDFQRGIAQVHEAGNDQGYYIDYTGKRVPDELVERIKVGLVPFEKDKRWGLVDPRTKEVVVEAKYYRIYDFSEGLALAEDYHGSPSGFRWFDYAGREVIARPVVGPRAGSFHEGLAAVAANVGGSGSNPEAITWGFIDRTGKYAIEPRFDDARDFHEGRAEVRVGQKWGYIDTTGKLVIPAKFDGTMEFSEGLAGARIAPEAPSDAGPARTGAGVLGGWGFIEPGGKSVIPHEYLWVMGFTHGRALVTREEFDGFIDHAGNVVLDTTDWSRPTSAK